MPKEIISGSAVGEGGYHVKVGWTRDCWVQVGVEADEGRSFFWTLLGTGSDVEQERRTKRLAEVGAVIRECVDKAPRQPEPMTNDETDLDPGNIHADSVLATLVLNQLDTLAHGMCSSVWSDLNRAGCNRLIQIVRKARDAAYGRDE